VRRGFGRTDGRTCKSWAKGPRAVPAFPLFRILPDPLKVPLHIQIFRSDLPSPAAYFARDTIEKPPESSGEVLEEPRGKVKTADRAIAVGTVKRRDKREGCQHRYKTTAFPSVLLLGREAYSEDVVRTLK
jgi:hypothetical protein